MRFDWIAKIFVPYQHLLYHLILAFGRFNLYIQSWKYVLTKKKVHYRGIEITLMLCFWVWFIWLLSYLPSISHLIAFLIISHAITLFLHLQITLSHFGMSTEEPRADETFFELALRTTMDVDCPVWLDWFHGGLQFQTEHHLFPRLPRHNLRKVVPMVKELAAKHGIHYHSYTFTSANKFVLSAMSQVAQQISAIINPTTEKIKIN
jgi:delta8-fatty-acid desaturase